MTAGGGPGREHAPKQRLANTLIALGASLDLIATWLGGVTGADRALVGTLFGFGLGCLAVSLYLVIRFRKSA